MSRKSEVNDKEIKFLREEIENQRRKTTADENVIKKLEYLIVEKLKIIEEKKGKNNTLQADLKNMENILQG